MSNTSSSGGSFGLIVARPPRHGVSQTSLFLVVVIVIPTSVARVAFTTNDDARPRLRIVPFSRVTAFDARRARASPPIFAPPPRSSASSTSTSSIRPSSLSSPSPSSASGIALDRSIARASRLVVDVLVASSTAVDASSNPSDRIDQRSIGFIHSFFHAFETRRPATTADRPFRPFRIPASIDGIDRSIDRSRSSGRGRRVERARALSRPFVETRSVCEITQCTCHTCSLDGHTQNRVDDVAMGARSIDRSTQSMHSFMHARMHACSSIIGARYPPTTTTMTMTTMTTRSRSRVRRAFEGRKGR